MFRKSTIKFYFLLLFFAFAIKSQAQVETTDSLNLTRDTIKIATDSVAIVDSVKVAPQENDIKEPISYSAKDSMRFSLKNKMIYAYGDAKLAMGEMGLDAGYIVMSMDSNYIYAEALPDANGELKGDPVFKQGSEEYEIETIKYNTKTKKGLVTDVVTEQNGGYLHGGTTKMQPNKEIHIVDGKFTTCDADHPHFYIKLTRAKVIPEKQIVTGPFYFVISDIPIPVLGLPFGFFPSQENRSSGIIIPTYGEEKRRGFFLQQGGYYWAASKNFDLTVLGSVFSSGSWTINARSQYKKRYKYGGNFDISYQKVVAGEREIIKDYNENTMFWVKLNYARDAKANPTSTFSASLNFGSSQHRKFNYGDNAGDPRSFANNNASSSVAYTKTFPGTPFNFSANINATQNLSDSTISLTLPTLTLNMSKQFPFKRKEAVGSKRWYEQISVGFSSQLENRINTKNSILFSEEAVNYFQNGFKYTVPDFNKLESILTFFNLSPGSQL